MQIARSYTFHIRGGDPITAGAGRVGTRKASRNSLEPPVRMWEIASESGVLIYRIWPEMIDRIVVSFDGHSEEIGP